MLIQFRHQRGMSLIEALVALLVISIGLLGIATLQLTSMKENTSALNHSRAVLYAYSMSDRIRANLSEFDNYDGIDTANGYAQDCMAVVCNTIQMRIADAADWATMVANLPAGRGIITSNADGLMVSVMWDDEGTGAAGTGCGPDTSVDLTCYSLEVAQ